MSQSGSVDQTRASIRIYTYNQEIGHKLAEIAEILDKKPKCKIPLRTIGQPPAQHWSTFEFGKTESDNEKVTCSVHVTRDVIDSGEVKTILLHHDICFTEKGFLIITGMEYRKTLLKCLTEQLHPNRPMAFNPRRLSKSEIQDITKRLLILGTNRIYQPRFHSFVGYRNREFNDFRALEDRCATEDSEYPRMMENCHYFEPIFKVNKICGEPLPKEGNLRVRHDGYFYSSQRMLFKGWLEFINTYVPWCLQG